MCRPKPGPRCYKHAATTANAADKRFHAAVRTLFSAPDETLAASQREVDIAKAELDRAERDLYASQTGAAALEQRLASDTTLDRFQRERLSRLYAESDALRVAKLRQQKLMPPAPFENPSQQATGLRTTLGQHREDLAHTDAQIMVLVATTPAGELEARLRPLLAERRALEGEVFTDEVSYRIVANDGHADTTYLNGDEVAALTTSDSDLRHKIVWLSHVRATADRAEAHPALITNLASNTEKQLLELTEGSDEPLVQRLHSGLKARIAANPTPIIPTAAEARVGPGKEALYGWQEGAAWQPREQSGPEWARQMGAHVAAVRQWNGESAGENTDDAQAADPTSTEPSTTPAGDNTIREGVTGSPAPTNVIPLASKRAQARRRTGRASGRRRPLTSDLTNLVSAMNPVAKQTRPPGITVDFDEVFIDWWL